jgi:hypothetical protein
MEHMGEPVLSFTKAIFQFYDHISKMKLHLVLVDNTVKTKHSVSSVYFAKLCVCKARSLDLITEYPCTFYNCLER